MRGKVLLRFSSAQQSSCNKALLHLLGPLISSHTVKTGTEMFAMYSKDFSQGQKEVGYLQNAPLPPKDNSLPKTGYGFSEFDSLGSSGSIPVLGNLRGKGKNIYPREESLIVQRIRARDAFIYVGLCQGK